MALQSSGAIKISEIATEFGGVAPHAMSEYYEAAAGVPSSGVIAISDFYGKADLIVTSTDSGGVGIHSTYGAYNVYTWTTVGSHSNSITFSTAAIVSVLVVGGGGGGGSLAYTDAGGGGGAGAMIVDASFSVAAGSYTVVVGDGGTRDDFGDSSSFSTLVATGGDGGGKQHEADFSHLACRPEFSSGNGSGGGGHGGNAPGSSGGTYGYSGIQGYLDAGGGGGGAGGVSANSPGGGTNPGSPYYATGGPGATNNYRTGSNVTYATGGNGGGHGNYGPFPDQYVVNSGNGGRGSDFYESSSNGEVGSSGIVVIRVS